MSLLSTKLVLPLIVLIAATSTVGAKDAQSLPASSAAASQYASIPHVVIVAKRLTPEQKRRQSLEERAAQQQTHAKVAAR